MVDWVLTVGELNEYVRKKLAGDPMLRAVSVRGEISGYKHHVSGHRYFTLKDENARVACVMFRQQALTLDFAPADGQMVIISGAASLYPQGGTYQLYVDHMRKEGAGELFLRFEALKKRLGDEGLFDPALKRPLPAMPRRVGIVTSMTGAALRDMLRVSRARNPRVEILIAPASVQGASAPLEIADAIKRLNRDGTCDVLLVGRGGGSIEDLWAFNEEIVARAIRASEIPVVSCVGHETDYTIADFVADARAATPSNAAEIAVPVTAEYAAALDSLSGRLTGALSAKQRLLRARLSALRASPALSMPARVVTETKRAQAEKLSSRMERACEKRAIDARHALTLLYGSLAAMNPGNVLTRGYAYVRAGERVISDAKALAPGMEIGVVMRDGEIAARVTAQKEETT